MKFKQVAVHTPVMRFATCKTSAAFLTKSTLKTQQRVAMPET
ncbi:MAG: hypothetical protein ACJASV_002061 [Pseudorhodobacter sp.]|jgi:hypothetical protein